MTRTCIVNNCNTPIEGRAKRCGECKKLQRKQNNQSYYNQKTNNSAKKQKVSGKIPGNTSVNTQVTAQANAKVAMSTRVGASQSVRVSQSERLSDAHVDVNTKTVRTIVEKDGIKQTTETEMQNRTEHVLAYEKATSITYHMNFFYETYTKLCTQVSKAFYPPPLQDIEEKSTTFRNYSPFVMDGYTQGPQILANYRVFMLENNEATEEDVDKKALSRFIDNHIGDRKEANLTFLPLEKILMCPKYARGLAKEDIAELMCYKVALYIMLHDKGVLSQELVDEMHSDYYPIYMQPGEKHDTVVLQLNAKGLGETVKTIDDIPGLCECDYNGTDKLSITTGLTVFDDSPESCLIDMMFFRALPSKVSKLNAGSSACSVGRKAVHSFMATKPFYERANELPFNNDVGIIQRHAIQKRFIDEQKNLRLWGSSQEQIMAEDESVHEKFINETKMANERATLRVTHAQQ